MIKWEEIFQKRILYCFWNTVALSANVAKVYISFFSCYNLKESFLIKLTVFKHCVLVKIFCRWMVAIVQQCKCTWCHWTIYLKIVYINFVLWKKKKFCFVDFITIKKKKRIKRTWVQVARGKKHKSIVFVVLCVVCECVCTYIWKKEERFYLH